MEQDSLVFEYEMKGEKFRFEAHNAEEAKKYRPYAMIHFQEKLGGEFTENRLHGPVVVVLRSSAV